MTIFILSFLFAKEIITKVNRLTFHAFICYGRKANWPDAIERKVLNGCSKRLRRKGRSVVRPKGNSASRLILIPSSSFLFDKPSFRWPIVGAFHRPARLCCRRRIKATWAALVGPFICCIDSSFTCRLSSTVILLPLFSGVQEQSNLFFHYYLIS